MPVVYLPLASAEAFGQIGEVIVYQGTTVRKYVIPYDPRTDAQLDVRHLFYDVTKILKTLGLFGRGQLAGVLGPRWYTLVYKIVTENGAARLTAAIEDWEIVPEIEQNFWREYAPYLATYGDPAVMWYCIGKIIYDYIWDLRHFIFIDVDWRPDVLEYRDAWIAGLSGVVTLAKIDNDDPRIIFRNMQWSEESDVSAYGGSYHKASDDGANLYFNFIGNKVVIGYVGGPTMATLQITFDGDDVVLVDQYRSELTYDLTISKTFPYKGIHHCEIVVLSNGSQIGTLDSIDSSNTKSAGVPKVEGATFALGVLEMVEQTVIPITPAGDKTLLYVKSDDKLYKLSSDGEEKEIGAGGFSQEDADERYPLRSDEDPFEQYLTEERGDARYAPSSLIGAKQLFVSGGANATIPASTTYYLNPNELGLNTGTGRNIVIPVVCVIRNLYFITGSAQPGSGSLVVEVLLNNVATSLAITIAASGAGAIRSDLTHSINVSAGDTLTIRMINNATGASCTIQNACIELDF